MKKICLDSPVFEDIIKDDFIYVDKTKYLLELLRGGTKYNFFSRPRRFGKSLTIYTLRAIFEGKKELFEGLDVYNSDYAWKKFPIVYLDFANINFSTVEKFEKNIISSLCDIAESNGFNIEDDVSLNHTFSSLISKLAKKSENKKIVILIDEYDKPLSGSIDNPELIAIREVLRNFYDTLKSKAEFLHFVFITGVTKFSKVNIFSSMNNLVDFSYDENYANMFGFTEKELKRYFKDYINKGFARTKKIVQISKRQYLENIKTQYDGYRFSFNSPTVYNPISIAYFFSKGGVELDNYWMETGNSQFLANITKKTSFEISKDLDKTINADFTKSMDIVELAQREIPARFYKVLLLQTGYLTLKKKLYPNEIFTSKQEYFLDFPNNEVKVSYASNILPLYSTEDAYGNMSSSAIINNFENKEIDQALQGIKSYISSIPSNLFAKQNEAHYHSLFHLIVLVLGGDVISEVNSNVARADFVLKLKNYIYIIEFKINKTADFAVSQILEKKYYEQFINDERKKILVGVNFSTKERNISDWKIKEI